MSEKLEKYITSFMNSVGEYIHMEYNPKFYSEYTKDKNLSRFYDFVGSYYIGGHTVPDTARCVVELIMMEMRNEIS